MLNLKCTCLLLCATAVLGAAAAAQGDSLAPFGEGTRPPRRQVKPAKTVSLPIDALTAEQAKLWTVEFPPEEAGDAVFAITRDGDTPVLDINAGALTPARSTVRTLLPGDGPANGDVWARQRATYVSFDCKANKPAQMTFHLLLRGKSAGTYQAGFAVEGDQWQRVILPVQDFGLRSFSKVAGVGVRTAQADAGTHVRIRNLRVGSLPFTDDSWKSHKLSISLKGDWHFAADPGDQGMEQSWFGDRFDDSAWKVLKAGESWQQQGIDHHGFGWYRQQIVIPADFKGRPLTLVLTKIASDDDVWFNGQRIGGFSGEYKYDNFMVRAYTVPASLIRYGQPNTIALRIWGGNLSFIGDKSGLVAGPLAAQIDPYDVLLRRPGGEAVPWRLFDLSDARYGKPFEMVFPFPAEIAAGESRQVAYQITDVLDNPIRAGRAPLKEGPAGTWQAVAPIDAEAAERVYLRGRLRVKLAVEDAAGEPLYIGTRELDQLNFLERDHTPLPPLADTQEQTPYGKLKLVDEIDCSKPLIDDPHPYLQSGFDHAQVRMTPGSPVDVRVSEILGKKARESEYGWFAYRIGRGKLKPHSTYLLRIEYPEDKPRFCPIEIQTGQNYMDVGWKNGVGPDDVYDNWPLSHAWQWYDVIVPLDDQTTGTGGTGTGPAENGFWVYFMNKLRPGAYYAMYDGGPAVARIKLYEIDPQADAPVIHPPEGLPHRVLSFDWERQPDHDPADLVRYAKLMGYNAISPTIIKWGSYNYSEPLSGYQTVNIDAHDYWVRPTGDNPPASAPVPDRPSPHVRYLEATRRYGIDYIPRIEWGGSDALPESAWARDVDGKPTKPNRFARWCANLLDPLAWDDLQKLMDHLVKPYTAENPQLAGVLWRIRCNRLPISYGAEDVRRFSEETGTPLPPGGEAQWSAWAAGEMKARYDDWWHQKRADFHGRLVRLLQSYRPGLTLYYYNWDEDKFGLIEPDITAWAFVSQVVKPGPQGGRAAYEAERKVRKGFTAADYISVLRSGNFGNASKGINRADYGLRPSLYEKMPGIQLFAPANYLCYAGLPAYLNYFRTADGVAVSNAVSYDEIGSRTINPKYEGNMMTPGGADFSMALELLSYFNADARTLNYTVYTYGRGFADAHRRFAQAFLALPAIPGTDIDQGDGDVKVRTYAAPAGTYVGVAYKGYAKKTLTIRIPAGKAAQVVNLVTNEPVPAQVAGDSLQFQVEANPMQLDAFLVK